MKTIFKKGLAVVAAAVLIVSLYFTAGVLLLANAQYNSINAKNLEEAAKSIVSFTPAAVFSDKDAAADWALHFGNDQAALHYRVTLIRANGQVIFDTDAESSSMENHLDRAEFQAAARDGVGSSRRRSATLGNDYFYTAAVIYDIDSRFVGVLRLSLLVPGFFSRLLGSAIPFLAGGILIILGVSAGLYGFSSRVSRELEEKLTLLLEEKTRELKAKTAEAEAEDRHREVILNSIFDGIVTLDRDLNIILANPRICSLFGVDAGANVRQMSLLEFSHSAELAEAARQVLETGQAFERAITRYAFGNRQHFQVFLTPLEQGVVMVLRDISRLLRLEQVRKDFAANVSHELRTPIQVIQGFAETMLDSSLDDREQIRYFTGIIKKNAQGMENLTNDLLTLVSLEDEDAARPPMVKTTLAPLLAEAVDALAIAARNKNISFAVSCPEDLCIQVHSTLFVQALVNLLDNGIKYSGEGSSIQVCAYKKGEEIVIEVKDKGIGIPTEHIDRIFERFYRVDRGRSREAGGTGLGLSIVRHIALLHNGTVEAESHAGEGSVFRLKLTAVEMI